MEALLEDLEENKPNSGAYILFTTAEYFENQMMPELEDYEVQTQILGSRERYIAAVVENVSAEDLFLMN